MSLEGVYDVPVYSAPTEVDDLWSQLDSSSWNGSAQQNQFLSQAPQWQPQPQPAQQVLGWPGAAPAQDYGAMTLMPEDAASPWAPTNGFMIATVPVPSEWPQNTQTVHQMTSQAIPMNHKYSPSLPVHQNNAATLPVPRADVTWAVESSQALANSSWNQYTPITGNTLAQCVSSNQVMPVQSQALPMNHKYSPSLPVHHNNAATLPVSHANVTWAVESSQALANSSWNHQTPITGKTLAQCVSSNQVMPVQTYQNNANSTNNINRPHFNITITPNRIARKVAKRKRVRTAFTTDQILALEKVFSTQTYVNKDERQALTEKLNISDRAIKVWFQNRRMKGKRESQATEYSDECEPESTEPNLTEARLEPSTSSDSYSSPSSELDYIEAHIQKPNERGYVILNDEDLDCLCNAIDTFVPEAIELVRKEMVPKKEIMYEPISPADTNGSTAEEVVQYEPPSDEMGRQELFKRHFC